jgi:3-methyladenine DNA glycosylase Tag
MSAEKFSAIFNRAAERKGGPERLELLLTAPLPASAIATITDDRFLSAFTKKVFQSGFVWRVVEQKWPAFEELFFQFDIEKVLLMPDEMLEKKASDPAIIRNFRKVSSIRDNAIMIKDVSHEHGSFAAFVNSFSEGNITDLWAFLKRAGARLGGNTGPYALRALGVDTFLLSRDVEAYFRQHKLIDGGLNTKRSLTTINDCFKSWQQESGLSYQTLSKIVAYSCGDNSIHVQ